jgi:EAL domain-containing protein (putative c-di-GMP-specific phosphodiesterase class I)
MGIASGKVHSDHPQDLVRRADLAMYHAKRLGKDRWEMYDAGLHERSLTHQRTEAALRNALAEDRFVLHYQPIVALRDSSVVGFEALVRLVDETGQLVPPDRFIGVAEQSGLIVSMGTWVLREACRTIAELRERTGTPLTVSVNVAARQVARPDFMSTVLDALASARLPEGALALELTESALLEANSSTLNQLTQLRNRGVQIALDDFGTGYSSLTYLRTFPVTHLKVDRSFVSGVTSVAGDLAIVRAVTQLAQDLGLGWVAEGIETRQQQRALAALGAGHGQGQGYLYSRPVPREQLEEVLRSSFTWPAVPRLACGA